MSRGGPTLFILLGLVFSVPAGAYLVPGAEPGSGKIKPSSGIAPSASSVAPKGTADRIAVGGVREQVLGGEIDWERGKVTVTVESYAPSTALGASATTEAAARAQSRRTAYSAAEEKLQMILENLRVDSSTAVRDYPEIANRLPGAVKGMSIEDLTYLDGGVFLKASLPIYGYRRIGAMVFEAILPKPGTLEIYGITPEVEAGTAEVATGLIIDATGVVLSPALSPKVTTPRGSEVYGTTNLEYDYVLRDGAVQYTSSLESAQNRTLRIGANPLMVKAIDSAGTNRADPVISEADAKLIRLAARDENFLRQCRVIIVLP